jgi:glycosyltransferase involved in cell wall biosynthesis
MTTSGPLVSVVVPMYNTEKYIGECIESVLGQTLGDLELIVVDDGSSDGSVSIAEELASRDQRMRLLFHPERRNMGVSRTRQLGVAEANGQYIAFLDADDAFEPDKLQKQVDMMRQRADCVMCHAAAKVTAESEDKITLPLERLFSDFSPETLAYRFHQRHDSLDMHRICLSTTMIRTEVLRQTNFSFPQLFQHEDWTLFVLLSLKGPFLFMPDALTRYRVHAAASQTRVRENPLVMMYSRIEFLLTVMASVDDDSLSAQAETRLQDTLAELLGVYANQVLAVRPARAKQVRRVKLYLQRVLDSWSWKMTKRIRRVFRARTKLFGLR